MALSLVFNDPVFAEMERMVDRAFERSLGPLISESPNKGSGQEIFRTNAGRSAHAFDIIERKDAYELVADAPGFEPSDVTVELNDRTLTVHGKHAHERKQQEGERVWRSERRAVQFSRAFTLPDNAQLEGITASLDKGILTVRVPKVPDSAKPQPKKITVTSAAAA
mmetsp:Transcript_6172/g.13439  ORF Transcript_6172/g.13439 Transcript_6172/m.13439 type:complete len:166 (-) Transcript_6172:253-750(-)